MVRREVLLGWMLVWGHGMACANGNPAFLEGASRAGADLPPYPAATQDEPPSALAVAAYLTDVLTPGSRARRTPTGYTLLDGSSRVTHAVDVALTSHQCWKIKDGYQCRSTVRTTTTPASGRAHTILVEISNDYQWRLGRLFSARLEAMRQQTLAQAARDDLPQDGEAAQGAVQSPGQQNQARVPGAADQTVRR
ncbi:MAG TPA: hypothetical protein H9903_16000 [Candidatus Aquabacterium excrementipullorum]|nr:hypothetical protein [Candidatus Aquabacterium excrementipullorum]